MFHLEALQFNGAWYRVASHVSYPAAESDMWSRGAWKRRAVKYRIIKS